MEGSAYIRTDLASECVTAAVRQGIRVTEQEHGEVRLTRTEILTEEGEKAAGKPRGTYVMLQIGKLWLASEEVVQSVTAMLQAQISEFSERLAPHAQNVLVAGLGNRQITPDALGPLATEALTVTRHVKAEAPQLYEALGSLALSAIAPGVTGQTGIETAELLKGVVAHVKPDLLIAIDALAARSAERLATSIQLSDSGIAPGSGVGNRRNVLSRETLGVPVLVIGVPTVVDSSTLIFDVLSQAGIDDPVEPLRAILENGRSFFVSLKESDEAVRVLAQTIATAINRAYLNV